MNTPQADQIFKDETQTYSNYLPLINLKTGIKYVLSGSYTISPDGTIVVRNEPHKLWQNFPS